MEKHANVEIPSQGRRLAVADIHACFATLRALVEEKIRLQKQDQLFLLGDYINRGPNSIAVLDYLIDLQKEGYAIYPLRGNHEAMLMDSIRRNSEWAEIGVPSLFSKVRKKVEAYHIEFLHNLPYYYTSGDFYLVHAGFNFKASNPFEDYESMLWVRDFTPDVQILNGRRIIHGHTIHYLSMIQSAINNQELVIPLDNGCYKGIQEKRLFEVYGNLCALDLDSLELIIQSNVD
jgi:serine/threonine protein phosphatase 1